MCLVGEKSAPEELPGDALAVGGDVGGAVQLPVVLGRPGDLEWRPPSKDLHETLSSRRDFLVTFPEQKKKVTALCGSLTTHCVTCFQVKFVKLTSIKSPVR